MLPFLIHGRMLESIEMRKAAENIMFLLLTICQKGFKMKTYH